MGDRPLHDDGFLYMRKADTITDRLEAIWEQQAPIDGWPTDAQAEFWALISELAQRSASWHDDDRKLGIGAADPDERFTYSNQGLRRELGWMKRFVTDGQVVPWPAVQALVEELLRRDARAWDFPASQAEIRGHRDWLLLRATELGIRNPMVCRHGCLLITPPDPSFDPADDELDEWPALGPELTRSIGRRVQVLTPSDDDWHAHHEHAEHLGTPDVGVYQYNAELYMGGRKSSSIPVWVTDHRWRPKVGDRIELCTADSDPTFSAVVTGDDGPHRVLAKVNWDERVRTWP